MSRKRGPRSSLALVKLTREQDREGERASLSLALDNAHSSSGEVGGRSLRECPAAAVPCYLSFSPLPGNGFLSSGRTDFQLLADLTAEALGVMQASARGPPQGKDARARGRGGGGGGGKAREAE